MKWVTKYNISTTPNLMYFTVRDILISPLCYIAATTFTYQFRNSCVNHGTCLSPQPPITAANSNLE